MVDKSGLLKNFQINPKGGDNKMFTLNIRIAVVALVVFASFIGLTTSAFAKSDSDVRPGWGYGDKNHVHIGPPGQSVFPGGVSQTNNTSSNVVLNVSSNTGGNSVSHNTGGGAVAIVTGAANTVISLITSVGHNIFGS